MGLARRGIRLPLPQAHRRLSDDILLTMLHMEQYIPQNPTNHHPRSLFNFDSSVFPRFPKTKKAQQGLGTASGVVVFWGFGVTVKSTARRRGINSVKVAHGGPFPGRRHTSPGFLANNNTTRAQGDDLRSKIAPPLLRRRQT